MSEELKNVVSEFGLESRFDEIAAHVKNSIRFQTNEETSEIATGASKLGGVPDLPEDLQWPVATSGIPYNFVFQLNLSEIESFEIASELPKEGILYFFISTTEMDEGVVLYSNASIDSLSPSDYPEIDEEVLEFEEAPEIKVFPSRAVSFRAYQSIPHPGEIGDYLELSEQDHQRYVELYNNYSAKGFLHQLFGYCFPVQTGIVSENQLLLQIDRDQTIDLEWGDEGIAYFSFPKDQLSIDNLDNISAFWQTH